MSRTTPALHPDPLVAEMMGAYLTLAAKTNEAMSAVLAQLSHMPHEEKMRVMRAVVLYGEAETRRAQMAKRVNEVKTSRGVQ